MSKLSTALCVALIFANLLWIKSAHSEETATLYMLEQWSFEEYPHPAWRKYSDSERARLESMYLHAEPKDLEYRCLEYLKASFAYYLDRHPAYFGLGNWHIIFRTWRTYAYRTIDDIGRICIAETLSWRLRGLTGNRDYDYTYYFCGHYSRAAKTWSERVLETTDACAPRGTYTGRKT